MKVGVSILVYDADIEGSGMQIDSTIIRVYAIVKVHWAFSCLGFVAFQFSPCDYAEKGEGSMSIKKFNMDSGTDAPPPVN
jgi:hypothetical protein